MSVLAVVTASLLGSLHCASMCGGFCTAVTAGSGTTRRTRRFGQLVYHLGRLVGYAGLALAAGAVGLGLQNAGDLAGLQNAAGIFMGVVLVAMAIRILIRRPPSDETLVQLGARPQPSRAQRILAGFLRRGGPVGAAGIGLGSAILPCGWLWGYVVLAAATGTISGSLVVIGAFWLGTIPALLSVGFAAGWLGRKLGPYAPRITAAVLLGLGVLAFAGKLQMIPEVEGNGAAEEVPPCHQH